MTDTPIPVWVKMREMYQAKTPEERLLMLDSMYEFSRELAVTAVLREHPHPLPSDLRKEIFLKFYGRDFDPKTRKKILTRLSKI